MESVFYVSSIATVLALKMSIDRGIPLMSIARTLTLDPGLFAENEITMLKSIEYSVMPTPEEYARFDGLAGMSPEKRMKDFYDYHATLVPVL
jgi:hypothetical protein